MPPFYIHRETGRGGGSTELRNLVQFAVVHGSVALYQQLPTSSNASHAVVRQLTKDPAQGRLEIGSVLEALAGQQEVPGGPWLCAARRDDGYERKQVPESGRR